MASLLRSALALRERPADRDITSVDDYIEAVAAMQFAYGGLDYSLQALTGTQGREVAERIAHDLEGYARSAYAANGVVFACMAVRMAVFSTIRFAYQRLHAGRPSELFGSPTLQLLETPWTGGTTQDLLVRLILDADLAGNAYWTQIGGELVRLRPDWVQIVLEPRWLLQPNNEFAQVGWRRLGYLYTEGGPNTGAEPASFLADEVAHFAPQPDPLANYRGMSWLTPVLREIENDKAMGRHKSKFFENAATPNLSVALDKDVSRDAFTKFRDAMNEGHQGVRNAYKTLYLGGGADVRVIGADFKQMDFKVVQGHGETRIAAAGGIPPIIVGLSEGLQSATYSNYGQARRRFADGTMASLWGNAAGSLATLLPPLPPGGAVRLWYDPRDVPFLREDQKDAAEIQGRQADTIRTLIEAGFEPDAAVRAVTGEDLDLLRGQHTGMTSVQLQLPSAAAAANTDPEVTGG